MPGRMLNRAGLRWIVTVICAALLVPLLGASAPDGADTALAQSRAQRLWTVTPGDAAGIQAAIDAAGAAGGGAVHLPAGEYRLHLKVRVHSNVAVFGDGMDRTILRWAPGATLDNMMSNATLTAGNSNLQIWDLTLDGEGRTSGSDRYVGLRLNNVRDSVIVNVAADRHSLDGIYLGYNRDNGAVNVRISGCRANRNARNGISLLHGDRNIIDNCQVNENNRGEAVAGIDVEPDEGLTVSNSKIVSNTANNQNVGIQLFVPYNGFATNANNAVCFNRTFGNTSAGIYDHRGSANIFVENQTSGNGTDFLVDDSSLVGSQYRGACQLPPLPPHPRSTVPTPTPTPPPTCRPRPPVAVQSRAAGAGALQVVLIATRSSEAPNNTIRQVHFSPAQNGTIELGGQNRGAGGFSFNAPPGTQSVTFLVRRATAGQATTVPFTVVDDCGPWPSFVGGGPGAF